MLLLPVSDRWIRRHLAPAVAVLTVVTLLAACAPGNYRPRPTYSYTPLPEAELYRRIAALPHVVRVSISYMDDFPNGERYRGRVTTDDQINPYVVLDQTIAILRQGVSNAWISINIEYLGPDGKPVLVSNTRDFPGDIDQRYGPQPGNGLPPAGPPVPTPTEWPPPSRSTMSPAASV